MKNSKAKKSRKGIIDILDNWLVGTLFTFILLFFGGLLLQKLDPSGFISRYKDEFLPTIIVSSFLVGIFVGGRIIYDFALTFMTLILFSVLLKTFYPEGFSQLVDKGLVSGIFTISVLVAIFLDWPIPAFLRKKKDREN